MPPTRNNLNLIAESAADIQGRLRSNTLTSVELVKQCLAQIERYDKIGPTLRAIVSIPPEATILKRAQHLDSERQAGRVLGPLHGIPIIIKDIFDTEGLPTTAGAWALSKTFGKGDSKLVQKLQEAGLIIIGKANLTELGAGKGPCVAGLSGLGGQTQSAYIEGGLNPSDEIIGPSNPGGSSSGSAVGVAAGYSPISIAGEADGSIMTPASRSALFALKCTPGTVSTEGMLSMAPTFESPGGMAKTVQDLAELISVVLCACKTPRTLQVDLAKKWTDFKIGALDITKWRLPPELMTSTEEYCRQVDFAYAIAMGNMESLGATVHYPVSILHPSEIMFEGESALSGLLVAEMRESTNAYLTDALSTEVQSLADIIQYNKEHPEHQAGIGQEYLIEAQESTKHGEWLARGRAFSKRVAFDEGILKTMLEHDLDFIISATDGPISSTAALAGCPTANAPLGYLEGSGRPFGLTFVAKPMEEGKLLEVLNAYEKTFPKRRLPRVLLNSTYP